MLAPVLHLGTERDAKSKCSGRIIMLVFIIRKPVTAFRKGNQHCPQLKNIFSTVSSQVPHLALSHLYAPDYCLSLVQVLVPPVLFFQTGDLQDLGPGQSVLG